MEFLRRSPLNKAPYLTRFALSIILSLPACAQKLDYESIPLIERYQGASPEAITFLEAHRSKGKLSHEEIQEAIENHCYNAVDLMMFMAYAQNPLQADAELDKWSGKEPLPCGLSGREFP